jgi:hypothetical protein
MKVQGGAAADLNHGTGGGCKHRAALRHRLKRRQTESFISAGKNECCGPAKTGNDFCVAQSSCQDETRESIELLRSNDSIMPLADDDE